MKTSLCLFSFLIFISACDSFHRAKTSDAKKVADEPKQIQIDVSAIPTEYSVVDSIPSDSLVVTEPKNPLDYMTVEEKSMIDEINLLRADPQAYSRFIDEYMQSIIADPSKDITTRQMEMATASNLINELQTMEPLQALLPHYRLYQVAKAHGKDMVNMKKMASIGSDGSHPFQRIYDGAELEGSERLFEGSPSVRESIISLLIENETGGFGQTLNLLDPRWEFVVCHEVGKVGDLPNVWIQLFGVSRTMEDEDVEVEMIEEEVTTEGELIEAENAIAEQIAVTPVVVETVENSPEADYSFMTAEEKGMVEEINLLRSNPAAYLVYVDAYAAKYEKEYSAEDQDFKSAVEELKGELKNMQPLSNLLPNEKLYNVAKLHGLDNKNHNRFEHIGTDKSDPFERVKRSGLKNYIDEKGYFAPNENLVGGEDTPRESVVALLIDSGVSSRGHRRALLQPNWEYVACYKIGLIENLKELKGREKDDMNNCWVQLFALD